MVEVSSSSESATASGEKGHGMERFQIVRTSRRMRRLLGAGLGRPLLGPQVVSLETTHHCNLRCSFCESHGAPLAAPITSTRQYVGGRRTMDLATIRRLAHELAEVETDLVELSGKGDPIAHPDLTEIVRAIRDAGVGCALVTNGTLASRDLAPTLVERGLSRLSVSLNAGGPESYLRSNKRDLWDRAIAFLQEVLEQRRIQGVRRPWVRITHVVTKENVDDFEGMIDICIRLGVDEVCFYVMGELELTTSLQLDPTEVARIQRGIAGWSDRLEAAGVTHELPIFAHQLAARAGRGTPQENALQRSLPCYEGWMFCVIGPDGVVVPCCYCEGENLGNVYEKSFVDIWYGALYNQFRKSSLKIPSTGRWICPECFTSCNRAIENRRIYNRTHPHSPVPLDAASIAETP
jgi:MoaA/NifB/PqqE/SkfB family radical SAM enzyme